jgi:hypothetical protein
MNRIFECIIAGGPQHGQLCRAPWDEQRAAPPAIIADDGEVCVAAARKHAGPAHTRFILLHPRATGEQFLTLLAA